MIEIRGPWRRISQPYGVPLPSMDYDEWHLWQGDRFVAVIEHFLNQPNRYIISQTWPIVEAATFEAICEQALAGGYTLLRHGPERRYQF